MERYFLFTAAAFAIVAGVADARTRRIPNWLTYGGLAMALVARITFLGWSGASAGFLGVLVAAGCYYILFLFGALGGGDVKLMAAIGAWAGPAQSVFVLLTVSIAGGLLALGYVLFSRRVLQIVFNAVQLIRYRVTSGLRPHLVLHVCEPKCRRVPLGLAIAAGTLYCAFNAWSRR